MVFMKHFALTLLSFCVFLFLLVLFLSNFNEVDFERYIFDLENITPANRFGELQDKNIVHTEEIKHSYGLSENWELSLNLNESIQQLRNNNIDAILISKERLEQLDENLDDILIVGENVFRKNYMFLVKERFKIPKRSVNIINRYFLILSKFARGDFGKTKNQRGIISEYLKYSLPFTGYLILFSATNIMIVSLLLSIILTSNVKTRVKYVIKYVLEIFSSVPEFLIAFGLLFIFHFNTFLPHWFKFYAKSNSFFNHGDLTLSWKLLKYFSLPVLTMSFANGTISVLTKLLTEKIEEYKNSSVIKFYKANGMKKKYINQVFVLKDITPVMFSFIAMKIPIIIGSSVIIEKIFDIEGIGNLAFRYFENVDVGMILAIFCLIYFFTIVLEFVLESINLYLQPIRRFHG